MDENKNFEQFRIDEMIGEGGMGKVYKAFDKQLRRDVALKIIAIEQFKKSDVDRFRREAYTMAKLKHLNIVKLYNFGYDGDSPFLTMELIKGPHLEDYVRKNNASVENIACVLIKIANAIHYAHQQGIIHRDLKPENIMMAEHEPKVMDFGLAKVNNASQRLSRSGTAIGTIAYMSPEQVKGQKVKATSDVYALGIILYQLLTRRLPFRGDQNRMMKQILDKVVPLPTKFNKKIPQELEIICLKCLEKKPCDRYLSAHDLAEDLKRFVRGKTIHARRNYSLQRRLGLKSSQILLGVVYIVIAIAMISALLPKNKSKKTKRNNMTKIAENKEKTAVIQDTEQKINAVLNRFKNDEHFDSLKTKVEKFRSWRIKIKDIVKSDKAFYLLGEPVFYKHLKNRLTQYNGGLIHFNNRNIEEHKFIYKFLNKNGIRKCLIIKNGKRGILEKNSSWAKAKFIDFIDDFRYSFVFKWRYE
ncbi:serine/threonine-protein kinase [Candidatus Uabimicrobium sp. HlEnr_7]|uniref:serine/threonine-protein kinase n=1 Tax=Candidatus Uabimicrobium helgolandensis TaxID=3095367 RepID=UPI003556A904